MFKQWLTDIQESVTVSYGPRGEQAALRPVERQLSKNFNYQFDNGYSTFHIGAYQANMPGYAIVSDKPSHIGIVKENAIAAGVGADRAFLTNLTQILQKQGIKSTTAQESGHFLDAHPAFANFPQPTTATSSEVPAFNQKASNMQQLTPGISVSKGSGSWSYYVPVQDSHHAAYMMQRILESMTQAAEPLIKNNIFDFYEIVDRATQKNNIVYSEKGQQEANNWKNQHDNAVAHLKHLADLMLSKKYPHAYQMVMDRINGVGVKVSGGAAHPGSVIPAKKVERLRLDDLEKAIINHYAEDHVLLFFLEVLKSNKDRYYEIFDKAAQHKDVLWLAEQLLTGKSQELIDHFSLWQIHNALQFFTKDKELTSVIPSEYEKFKKEYQAEVNDFFLHRGGGDELARIGSKSVIKQLDELSRYINIDPKISSAIDQAVAQIKEQEAEAARQKEAAEDKRRHIISEDEWKYVVITQGHTRWENVPYKYYYHHRDNEMFQDDIARFCDEIADDNTKNGVAMDAEEKGREETYEKLRDRPSETYGEDKAEVSQDIEYDWEEFVNDTFDREEDDLDEQGWIKYIKENEVSEFIEWKKKQLEEKEDNNGSYKPKEGEDFEADREEVQDAYDDLIIDAMYDNGLVLCHIETSRSGNMSLVLYLNAKFLPQAKPLIEKTVRIMTQERDEEYNEPYMKTHTKIDIVLNGGKIIRTNAYDVLTKGIPV